MEHKTIINLDNTPNQPTKFRAKDWVETADNSRGRFNTGSQYRFKTSMLRSSLWEYSDACIRVSGTITVEALAKGRGNNDIQVVFKNCAPFTNCMSKMNNTQIDNAKGIDVVMLMHNLIEYSDNCSKASGSLWPYHRDERTLNAAGVLDDFLGNSASFNLNKK